ncbi:MAG TPA: sigma-54 dependent transcriptional regulator [Nitrospirota bacterium]|nr:sigma-54 dependent transcriptional regulator [Nitrospirota bacterium]
MEALKGKLLIVDDDLNLLELMKLRLESSGYAVEALADEDEAKTAAQAQAFDLAILDLQLVRSDGITLMQELHRITPGVPVIILTAHGTVESAVEAMKQGAYTYLTKPFDARELIMHVEHALENRRMSSEIDRLKEFLTERYDFGNIVTRSEQMKTLLHAVARVAATESTVFVRGESGTGKELIARAIHLASSRMDKPFVAVNCAALPETLLESELFGHEKGAFTGAVKSAKGLFAQAHEGTIFLDEIGDMPLSTQAKFLRVLQERQFYPVGGERPLQVDVRVIVATNQNVEELVKQGRFREDLYYRIHVIPVTLPPLRDRKEDIAVLTEHFLRKFSDRMGKQVKGITPGALQRLMRHDWPGNVRELENTIEYAVAMSSHDIVTEDMILPATTVTEEMVKPLKEAREDFEKVYLVKLLEITQGNVSSASNLAGKYRADFYNLLKKYNINPAQFKKE